MYLVYYLNNIFWVFDTTLFFHHLIGPSFVLRHQGSLHKSDGFIPKGGAKYKGVAIFYQYAAISRKGLLDRGIVPMEDEYEVVLCSIE